MVSTYRGKGKDFTITSSTAFDQKWINGKNTYDSISNVVDEIFNSYLSRPEVTQPILTQYCDGNRVNIQDGSVLHTLYEKSTIEIGDDVSIGHNVTIHGATIHDGALVGMGSVILDHAVVGEGAIVAAGSVVLSKTVIKPGELWGGTPAKFIKMVDPEQSKEINQKIAKNYLMYSKWYEEE